MELLSAALLPRQLSSLNGVLSKEGQLRGWGGRRAGTELGGYFAGRGGAHVYTSRLAKED